MSHSIWTPSPSGSTASRQRCRDGFHVRRGVKALVTTSDGSVLLIRERHADGTPFWTLPGGGVQHGESATGALEREVAEELQCTCVPGAARTAFPYVHYSRHRTASVYVVYDCALLTSPRPNGAHGVTAARWASPESLPSGTLPQVRAVVSEHVA